jgi:hypothetical protein
LTGTIIVARCKEVQVHPESVKRDLTVIGIRCKGEPHSGQKPRSVGGDERRYLVFHGPKEAVKTLSRPTPRKHFRCSAAHVAIMNTGGSGQSVADRPAQTSASAFRDYFCQSRRVLCKSGLVDVLNGKCCRMFSLGVIRKTRASCEKIRNRARCPTFCIHDDKSAPDLRNRTILANFDIIPDVMWRRKSIAPR